MSSMFGVVHSVLKRLESQHCIASSHSHITTHSGSPHSNVHSPHSTSASPPPEVSSDPEEDHPRSHAISAGESVNSESPPKSIEVLSGLYES